MGSVVNFQINPICLSILVLQTTKYIHVFVCPMCLCLCLCLFKCVYDNSVSFFSFECFFFWFPFPLWRLCWWSIRVQSLSDRVSTFCNRTHRQRRSREKKMKPNQTEFHSGSNIAWLFRCCIRIVYSAISTLTFTVANEKARERGVMPIV